MTVLLLTQVFPPRTGGSGRWLWELYRRLSGIRVHVVAGNVSGADDFDRTAPLPITRLPLDFASWGLTTRRSAAQYARGVLTLRRIARECKADVIDCGKCLPEGLLAAAVARLGGPPFRVFVHGEELALAHSTRELRYLTRLVLRAAQRVIANSEHSKRLLVEAWQVPAAGIHVLHPGVDTDRFVPAPVDAGARARLGWANRRVIATVGALQQRKGQDMLIRALPAIRRQCPDVLYEIVGEGWERARLEALAVECGVADLVHFRGVPDDAALIEIFQQCDLFALPNRQVEWDFEGFGIALIEAQACGRPVLAGRSGGAPETTCDGVTGLVVDCRQPDTIAEAIVALLNDAARRCTMGRAARDWAVSQFDWKQQAARAGQLLAETR